MLTTRVGIVKRIEQNRRAFFLLKITNKFECPVIT